MTCPKCGDRVAAFDICHNTDTNETYRRRKCVSCGYSFTTVEFEIEQDEHLKREWNKHCRQKQHKRRKG